MSVDLVLKSLFKISNIESLEYAQRDESHLIEATENDRTNKCAVSLLESFEWTGFQQCNNNYFFEQRFDLNTSRHTTKWIHA